MLRRTTLLLIAAAAVAASTARGQSRIAPDPTPRLPPQPGQGMPIDDVRSLQRAALVCDAQAEAGRIGAQRAGSPELRRLAETISSEHTRFLQDIRALAGQRQIQLPDRSTARVQDTSLSSLSTVSGSEFDRAFVARQLSLYTLMAELFQTMASNSPDPALQRLGITLLTTARTNFEVVRHMGEPMGLRVETVEAPPQY